MRELAAGHPTLELITQALLSARSALAAEFAGLDRRVRTMARSDRKAKLLMSMPGVGAIVALTVSAAIDDPARFRSSKAAGAHFGLTPRKYQSGETDVTAGMRKAKVALARRLAVVLHRMLADGAAFNPDLGGAVAQVG